MVFRIKQWTLRFARRLSIGNGLTGYVPRVVESGSVKQRRLGPFSMSMAIFTSRWMKNNLAGPGVDEGIEEGLAESGDGGEQVSN